MRKVDIVSGAIFVVVGTLVLIESLQLDFYAQGSPDPGSFRRCRHSP